MSGRPERPDLEGLKSTYLIATQCVDPRITSSATLALSLIAYALQLEQDAAALPARLRAIEWDEETDSHQCAWCMAPKVNGHDDGCKFAAILAVR